MTYSVSSSTYKLSIIVPRHFSPFLFAFIPLWITLWITFAVKAYRSEQHQSRIALLFFGTISVLFLYRWLWNLFGRSGVALHWVNSYVPPHPPRYLHHSGVFMAKIAEPHFVQSTSAGRSRIPRGI